MDCLTKEVAAAANGQNGKEAVDLVYASEWLNGAKIQFARKEAVKRQFGQ